MRVEPTAVEVEGRVYERDRTGHWRSNGVLLHPLGVALLETVIELRRQVAALEQAMTAAGIDVPDPHA